MKQNFPESTFSSYKAVLLKIRKVNKKYDHIDEVFPSNFRQYF